MLKNQNSSNHHRICVVCLWQEHGIIEWQLNNMYKLRMVWIVNWDGNYNVENRLTLKPLCQHRKMQLKKGISNIICLQQCAICWTQSITKQKRHGKKIEEKNAMVRSSAGQSAQQCSIYWANNEKLMNSI